VAEIDESASEKEEEPTPAAGEVADDADDDVIQVFDLDDIEVMESKVFG
jgi:hypothetical protein